MTTCDICDTPSIETDKGLIYVGRTGELESHLCENCFKGIGYFYRDIALLFAASEYIELHNLALGEFKHEQN